MKRFYLILISVFIVGSVVYSIGGFTDARQPQIWSDTLPSQNVDKSELPYIVAEEEFTVKAGDQRSAFSIGVRMNGSDMEVYSEGPDWYWPRTTSFPVVEDTKNTDENQSVTPITLTLHSAPTDSGLPEYFVAIRQGEEIRHFLAMHAFSDEHPPEPGFIGHYYTGSIEKHASQVSEISFDLLLEDAEATEVGPLQILLKNGVSVSSESQQSKLDLEITHLRICGSQMSSADCLKYPLVEGYALVGDTALLTTLTSEFINYRFQQSDCKILSISDASDEGPSTNKEGQDTLFLHTVFEGPTEGEPFDFDFAIYPTYEIRLAYKLLDSVSSDVGHVSVCRIHRDQIEALERTILHPQVKE